jgi:hypothetical protein
MGWSGRGCKESVKVHGRAVRKASTGGTTSPSLNTFILITLRFEECAAAGSRALTRAKSDRDPDETETRMGVLIYAVLTVAVFAVLGLAQKLVERL